MPALRNTKIAPSPLPLMSCAGVRWSLAAGCVSAALLLSACGKSAADASPAGAAAFATLSRAVLAMEAEAGQPGP